MNSNLESLWDTHSPPLWNRSEFFWESFSLHNENQYEINNQCPNPGCYSCDFMSCFYLLFIFSLFWPHSGRLYTCCSLHSPVNLARRHLIATFRLKGWVKFQTHWPIGIQWNYFYLATESKDRLNTHSGQNLPWTPVPFRNSRSRIPLPPALSHNLRFTNAASKG